MKLLKTCQAVTIAWAAIACTQASAELVVNPGLNSETVEIAHGFKDVSKKMALPKSFAQGNMTVYLRYLYHGDKRLDATQNYMVASDGSYAIYTDEITNDIKAYFPDEDRLVVMEEYHSGQGAAVKFKELDDGSVGIIYNIAGRSKMDVDAVYKAKTSQVAMNR